MRKADVLRFGLGDLIEFTEQPNYNGRDVMQMQVRPQTGAVLAVTSKGGVRVRPQNGGAQWLPYNLVIRRLTKNPHARAFLDEETDHVSIRLK